MEPLPAARRRMASALGAAGRRLWRRTDLGKQEMVVVDLVAEALQRLARLDRPPRAVPPSIALSHARPTVLHEVRLLAALAVRAEAAPVGGPGDERPRSEGALLLPAPAPRQPSEAAGAADCERGSECRGGPLLPGAPATPPRRSPDQREGTPEKRSPRGRAARLECERAPADCTQAGESCAALGTEAVEAAGGARGALLGCRGARGPECGRSHSLAVVVAGSGRKCDMCMETVYGNEPTMQCGVCEHDACGPCVARVLGMEFIVSMDSNVVAHTEELFEQYLEEEESVFNLGPAAARMLGWAVD